jgi:DNA-binding transcriptional MerR regulator
MAKVTEKASVQPDYGIGAMARRLGVAPATLRDWERRYGIGPGGRTAGGHRRYRPDDIARIEYMRRLVLDGVPPGEAARVALAAAPTPESTAESAAERAVESAPEPTAESIAERAAESAPESTAGLAAERAVESTAEPTAESAAGLAAERVAESAVLSVGASAEPSTGVSAATRPEAASTRVRAADARAADGPAWGSGGRSLPLPDQTPQARGLARAALALDAPAISRVLDRSLREAGVVATWEKLAVPVLVAIGERHAATGSCIDVEHLLSAQLLTALATLAGRLSEPVNTRPVLLACADDEQHSLPLYALAAALAERRVGTRMLGARTPPAALAEAVARIGPAAAFIWSQTPATADAAQLARLPRQRPPLRLLVAGPGWLAPPPSARQVATLPEAVQQACEAVGLA